LGFDLGDQVGGGGDTEVRLDQGALELAQIVLGEATQERPNVGDSESLELVPKTGQRTSPSER
jgi:hypothetical protein